MKSALILLPFLTVAQHESDIRNSISWSVTVYNKTLCSQCNLTAQMEPIQDDNKYNLYHIIHISADTLTTVVEDQKKLKSFGIPIL